MQNKSESEGEREREREIDEQTIKKMTKKTILTFLIRQTTNYIMIKFIRHEKMHTQNEHQFYYPFLCEHFLSIHSMKIFCNSKYS